MYKKVFFLIFMQLNLLFSESQIQLTKKFALQRDIDILLQKFDEKEIDQNFLKKEITKLIDTKIKELQNILALDLKKTELINPFKMTTIDGWSLHKTINEMQKNSCESIILELSSQGLEQNRHWGLGKLFIAGFLNIFPEHIESHGSFENYIKAKAILFSIVKPNGFVIANESNQLAEVLKNNSAQTEPIVIRKKYDYSISEYSNTMYKSFEYAGVKSESYFLANFEVENAIFGSKIVEKYLKVNRIYEFNPEVIHRNYFGVPGRMEWVVLENDIV